MKRSRWISAAAVMTAWSFLAQSTAHAYPAELHGTHSAVPSPMVDATGAPVDATGAAVYAIPIPTAPNRNGLVPALALSYSSRNPVRGGVAMGWALAIPRVELDTSDGRLGAPRYRAAVGRLIRVDEPVEAGWEAYRGEFDASFTRYERQAGMPAASWRARTPDGTVHFFGETAGAKDVNHPGAAPDAHEGRWFLTRTVDHFGNEVRYNYQQELGGATSGSASMPVDVTLVDVEYGANPAAGLTHHTRIVFEHAATPDLCPGTAVPIGARFDLRTGIPIYEGAARLTGVRLETRTAGGPMAVRRRLDLTYDAAELTCAADRAHAPLRILTAVQETGYAPDGAATVLPPQTFTYNRLERMFDVNTTLPDSAGLIGGGVQGPSLMTYPEASFARPIVQSMLLDVDADARPDRVQLDTSDPAACRATWSRNLGGLGFAPAAPLGDLPIAPWANGATRGDGELCSLTHQVSAVTNRADFVDELPAACAIDAHPPLPPRASDATHGAYRYVDWDRDGVLDLVAVIESRPDHYRPELDPRVASAPACAVCPGTVVPGIGCVPANENVCTRREEWSCGQSVVRLRRGTRAGGFQPVETLLLPQPFDPEENRDGKIHGLMLDLDGDGREDGVRYLGTTTSHRYDVQRNLGDGGFAPVIAWWLPMDKGYEQEWNLQNGELETTYDFVSFAPAEFDQVIELDQYAHTPLPPPEIEPWYVEFVTSTLRYSGSQLADVNGDGLPDLVSSRGTGLRAFYNQGAGFETHSGLPEGERGNLLTGAVDHLESSIDKMYYEWADPEQPNVGQYQKTGSYEGPVTRLVDFDGDGLRDLVSFTVPEEMGDPRHALLHVNVGDGFRAAENENPIVWRALEGLAHRVSAPPVPGAAWSYHGDLVDLDGDGLPEVVQVTGGGAHLVRSDSDTQPMRLLKAIDNGRGGRTELRYQAISGQGVPGALWVVDRVTELPGVDADGVTAPAMITTFDHEQPVYGPDLDGDYGFRGFARSTAVSPAGARTVTTRSFAQHFAGLVTQVDVFGADDRPLSQSTTTYEERHLFDGDSQPGMVRTFHPSVMTTRTCKAGQSAVTCASAGDRSTTELFYVAMAASGGPAQLHALQWQRQGAGPGALAGSRGTWFASTLRSGAGQYLRTSGSDTTFLYGAGGATTIEAQTSHYFDGTGRFELWTSQWVGGSQWAVTSRVYDTATGNLTQVITPRYYGTGPGSTLEYDADKRFVTAAVNTLGHRSESITDPATGVELSQRGPNVTSGVRDGWISTIDGLGRERTHSVMLDDAVLGYRPELVSQTSYVDTASPRNKIIRETKLDLGGTRFAKTESEFDGLGRAVIERSYEGAFVRAETRRFHDARGLMTRTEVPKPGAIGLAWVTWLHEYDELGRPLAVREPTRTGCTGPLSLSAPFAYCGKRWSYDGFATTVEDVVGSAGGQIGRKRETRDAFGRLARSELGLDGGAWAATVFSFDARDHIVRVDSADGVATINTHDGLGRRTSVLRGANLWQFGHDGDGNLISQTSPVPAGGVVADFTTVMVYDALGRETSRTAARRDWSAADEARFGSRVTTRAYDSGDNGVGRLASVTQSWGSVAYAYEARGLVTEEQHHLVVPETSIDETRTLRRTYMAHGAVEIATEADGATPASSTQLQTYYDDRGLPVVLEWRGHGVIDQVGRSGDGRVVDRLYQDASGIVAQSAATFDEAGRMKTYTVSSRLSGAPGVSERAAQIYQHDGAGDVVQLDSRLSATATPGALAVSQYGYDAAHRLVSASGELGYAASFGYSPGGRLVAAEVDADPAALRVHRRDVTYTYASQQAGSLADPDAPVALPNAGAAGDFMTLTYDRAGNVAGRVTTDGTFTHRHDGLDHQREVVNPDGSSERYYYDGMGLRALVVHVAAGGAITGVTWTLGNTELRLDDSGAVERSTASGNLGAGATRIVDQTSTERVFQDPRLHTLAVLGGDGALKAGFSYGPYGELLRELGSASSTERERFNGKVFDAASGLSYYGFRYYDERSLTWTQADPYFRFAVRGDASDTLYSFSGGNPVSRVDLAGLQPANDPYPDDWIVIWDCRPGVSCEPQEPTTEEKFSLGLARFLALYAINACRHDWCKDRSLRDQWKEEVLRRRVHVLRTTATLQAMFAVPSASITANGMFHDAPIAGAPDSTAFVFGKEAMYLSPAVMPGGTCFKSACPMTPNGTFGIVNLAAAIAHEALHPAERAARSNDYASWERNAPLTSFSDKDEGRVWQMEARLFQAWRRD